MSLCEFCNTESTIIFTCPYCGNRFCKEHRKPEKHNCPTIQSKTVIKPQTIENPTLETDNVDETLINNTQTFEQTKTPQLNTQTLDGSIEIVKAQSRAVIASLFGSMDEPENYDEEYKDKFDKIYDYFLKIWEKNQELQSQIEKMKYEISELQNQLDKKNIELEKILAENEFIKE